MVARSCRGHRRGVNAGTAMAGYDLDRLSVLVVDDSAFMRSTLKLVLKALGVGKLKDAEHGGEAIDILHMMGKDPVKAGLMSVDLIFSNWQMSPVDGLMLLRWVRRHKDSPDRFIPFVMVTAHAEKAKIEEARELGVTEMLVKPYSADMVVSRLLQAIDHPRQFVHTGDYFGPDRRRHQAAFVDKDRRHITDKSPEAEVVSS
jgi:two-component system, chemotaxis family, chemotaxis protein CheY